MNGIQQPLLRVEGVYKSFHASGSAAVEVLRGASLAAGAGEMVAITGASGSGKSTLLHVVGGLERADAGRIWIGDYDLSAAAGNELARARNELIGFVFQFHHLLPDLTAAENVALPLLIARHAARASRAEAERLLAEVGLADCARRAATELSGGEQQRVAFARALAGRPRLLLADEPTGNLDAANADACAQLLRRLCQDHQLTAIVATHSERLARICDRAFALEGGSLIAAG